MRPGSCEHCGATLVPIRYGMPGPEMWEAAERGEIVIGGCVIRGDDPTYGCPNCYRDLQWGLIT